ncbi:MAG: TolC family protein [Cyanobacteria bacterium REEB67]|nr:TolC family protein [Cyanobacteria bacterium REEB67]
MAPALAAQEVPLTQLSASTNLFEDRFPRRHLSLADCFSRAERDNREIAVAYESMAAARAQITIAGALPNPVFNSTYGFGPAWEYIAAGNNQQVGWTEELLVLGKRSKKISVARAQFVQNGFQLQATKFSVHNRVRRAYCELTAAFAYAALVEEQKLIASRLLTIAGKRYDAGKAPGSEVWQARLGVLQFDTQISQARGRLVQASVRLAQLLGELPRQQEVITTDGNSLFAEGGGSTTTPDYRLVVPELGQILPAAFYERNDLRAAIQLAYADKLQHKLSRTLWLPDPFVGFNFLYSTYKKNQPLYLNINAPFQPGFQLDISHETPIFYYYQGQRKQAAATVLQQVRQCDLLTSQIALAVVSAYEALLISTDNLRKYKNELLPAAARVAQLSRRSYELGKSDLATAMLAQQQYQQIKSSYFDAVVAYQNVWADLENAVGVPLNL